MAIKEYLDLEKDYFILVPLNEEGLNELYSYDIYKDDYVSNNIKAMIFHEDTFCYMESRLFDFINVECNLLINIYEEEIAETDQLMKILDITDLLIKNSDDEKFLEFANEFRLMITTAIEKNSCIGFYF